MSKVMEMITFPGGSEPYQVRDGRIPENPGNYQYLVTDGNGKWGTADRLAYSIPAFSFECPASSVGLESFVTAGEEGDTTYYLISAGSYPLEGFKNMSITDPESQNVETAFYEQYGNKHTARFELENGYGNFTWLYWFDGQTTISDGLGGTITPQAGIWQGTGGDAAGITAFTANYAGKVQPIDPAKWLPEGYPYGEEHSVVLSTSGGVAFEGEDKGEGAPSYYLVYAGNVSDAAWNNLTVTNPSGEQLIDADSADNGNTRYFRDDNYYYTVLCRFDGTRTVTNSTGTITPAAGIYWRMGYNEMGGNGFTVDFGFVQTMAPKFLPYNVFVVTLNYNEDSIYPTPDKTWDEVFAAYNSGAAMFVRNNVPDDSDYHSGIVGKHMLLPFTEIDAEKATFCGVYLNPDSSSTECYICRGYVNADGTGKWLFNTLSGVSTPT